LVRGSQEKLADHGLGERVTRRPGDSLGVSERGGWRPAERAYVDRIVKPAREFGFPGWYVERLESFRAQVAGAHHRDTEAGREKDEG